MKNAWLSLAVSLTVLVSNTPSHAEGVDAIWKTHHVAFYFGSSTTHYSCSSLTEKVAKILRRVGAERDVQVAATACSDFGGLARVEIRFRSPVPATNENLAAATQYDATQLLGARLRGEGLPAAEDLQRFPAEWRTVSFSRDPKLRLAPADCDLVKQLHATVFSRMSIRVEWDRLWCSSVGSAQRPQLTVTALVAGATDVRQLAGD